MDEDYSHLMSPSNNEEEDYSHLMNDVSPSPENNKKNNSSMNIFGVDPKKADQSLIEMMPELKDPKFVIPAMAQVLGGAATLAQPELMAGRGLLPYAANA